MSNLKSCYELLHENEDKVYTEVCNVLSRLCKNVIDNPGELKYRKVRLGNAIIAEKIIPAIGAMECLFEIGFVEQDDHLLLPESTSLDKLKELQRLLSEPQIKKAKIIQANQETNSQIQKAEIVGARQPVNSQIKKAEIIQANQPTTSASHPASFPIQPSTSFARTNNYDSNEETKFFQQIKTNFQNVLTYENDHLKSKARNYVPLVDLQINAMEKMRLIQREVKSSGDNKSVEDISIEDLLLSELLKWFKEEFFQWVDSPECTSCSGKCSFQRVIPSKIPGASRIEIHRCETCANVVQFPRYSDPAMLLHTRKGRCGEWANAFALLCRSLGYDTRYVWECTDHVWVEIWSVAANRWIHADPCENVMDRPLLYEKGWGKKLNYIFAFSKDEVQDVTWRYTADQKAVLKRRKLCSEQNLIALITSLTENRRRTSCSTPRQKFLVRRSLLELVEMITFHFGNGEGNKNDKEEYQGRTSGSLAWRLSRHETKVDSSSSHVWHIPPDTDSVRLSYSTTNDEYLFVNESGKVLEKKKGWEKGIHETKGRVFRKVENDWKMVYLVRGEENDCGQIKWTFETADSNLEIINFKFRAITAVFHGASVEWKVEGFYRNGESRSFSVTDSEQYETEQFKGASKISLSAILSGGDGELAWQHAQLFRQKLDSKENAMEIDINLGKIVQ